MKSAVFGIALFISAAAQAGGWTSGGGELIRDGHNPWFLQNTKSVTYCIQIDEQKFGQNLAFARKRVEKAIDFWKRQLTELDFASAVYDFSFKQGTQEFRETPCSAATDLTFQFAYLTTLQKERLGDISKMAAVTIRTDYDLVNLKGKGFIYLQPDSALPFNPWTRSSGSRVFPILIHELGHVFGIQHNDAIQFMKEDFAESIVDTETDWDDQWTENLDSGTNYQNVHLFSFHRSQMAPLGMCAISSRKPKSWSGPTPTNTGYRKFFGTESTDNCFSKQYDNGELQIFSGVNKSTLIGKAVLVTTPNNLADMMNRSVTAIEFWIPKEQKVFQTKLTGRFRVGFFVPSQIFKGTYSTLNGKVNRLVSVEVANNGWVKEVAGLMDDVIYVNVMTGL